jgi:hypothetical protein
VIRTNEPNSPVAVHARRGGPNPCTSVAAPTGCFRTRAIWRHAKCGTYAEINHSPTDGRVLL